MRQNLPYDPENADNSEQKLIMIVLTVPEEKYLQSYIEAGEENVFNGVKRYVFYDAEKYDIF